MSNELMRKYIDILNENTAAGNVGDILLQHMENLRKKTEMNAASKNSELQQLTYRTIMDSLATNRVLYNARQFFANSQDDEVFIKFFRSMGVHSGGRGPGMFITKTQDGSTLIHLPYSSFPESNKEAMANYLSDFYEKNLAKLKMAQPQWYVTQPATANMTDVQPNENQKALVLGFAYTMISPPKFS